MLVTKTSLDVSVYFVSAIIPFRITKLKCSEHGHKIIIVSEAKKPLAGTFNRWRNTKHC